jgi:formylglycine-generating enzyme required for sulfatase activity
MGQLSEMALISGGAFMMGSEDGYIDERPVHLVEVAAFYLDVRVVTNREFQEFISANSEWRKDNVLPEMADQNFLNLWANDRCPDDLLDYSVINVSQPAAAAFARWAGKRLPTEAEWEYAAGAEDRLVWSVTNKFDQQHHEFGLDGGQPRGSVPAQHRPNGYGLYDMCGLVWEWTQDRYDDDFYQLSERVNPVNRNQSAEWAVLRGGSAYFDDPFFLRIHIRGRNVPAACNEDYGFRCARDA